MQEGHTAIRRYCAVLPLSPISIARDGILVDGLHRWQAHKREGSEQIAVENLDNLTDVEMLKESIRRNARHGRQLDTKDKRRLADQLYRQGTRDVGELIELPSITPKTLSEYLRDNKRSEKEEQTGGVALTENLLLKFDQCVVNLSRQIKHGGDTLKMVPDTVKQILGDNRYHQPMWPRRFCSILGEVVTFDTFVEFVEANQPRGLGVTVQILKSICREDIEATTLIDRAVKRKSGRPPKTVYNVHNLDRPAGNKRERALRRLRDHCPDLHARVIAEELSAHKAMIEAGFRTRTFTVPDA